jgi:acetate kinase
MKILVLNAGSSSQKSCLYDIPETGLPDQPPHPIWEGAIDWSRQKGMAAVKVETATGKELKQEITSESREADTLYLLKTLWNGDTQVIASPEAIDAVGHRVVHGGEEYHESVRITSEVKAAIARLAAFAPIHNPVNLAGIDTMEQILGTQVPQVAVFDTAFHTQLPPAAYTYPIPYEFTQQGVRRYGFHGTSHKYCTHRVAQLMGRPLSDLRIVICHLGNGCSLAAVKDGHSVDTTMGFTPLDGLTMGTRSGSIDPGIIIHLMRQKHYTADDMDQLLNKSSGLLGISGVSSDMRQIEAAIKDGNDRAKLALDVFIHNLRSEIAAMVASLGGLDALVFTAGIGENSPPIRSAACEALSFMNLTIDAEKNGQRPVDQDIATPDSQVRVFVIHTQEDWAIAQDCWRIVTATAATPVAAG